MEDFRSGLSSMDSAILSMNQTSQSIFQAFKAQEGLVENFKTQLQEIFYTAESTIKSINEGHQKWVLDNEEREKRLDNAFKQTEARNRQLDDHQRNVFNETIKMHDSVNQNNQKAIEDLRKAAFEYENRLNISLKGLEDTLISLTNDFGATYKTFLEQAKGLIGNP
jgi:multidrug resistance efflux pump